MDARRIGRSFVGVVLLLAGLALGIYLGLWVCLIGGIVQLVDGIKATPTDAWAIAFGGARVLCAGVVGVLTAIVACFPGYAMLQGR